jgi:hypothetical protein
LVEIAVKNLLGEAVYELPQTELNAGAYSYSLNLEGFSKGIYLVEVKVNGSIAAVKKLSRQ